MQNLKRILEEAVIWAKENGYYIKPNCTFDYDNHSCCPIGALYLKEVPAMVDDAVLLEDAIDYLLWKGTIEISKQCLVQFANGFDNKDKDSPYSLLGKEFRKHISG